jgi:UDP-N-acetylmuramoyl-tripeptide--D-alanyl-D-alanine ligase
MGGSHDVQVTAAAVAEATGGTLVTGDPSAPVGGVAIDSRRVTPGDVFFAIKGPRFDAHDFVPAVLAASAAGAVVSALPTGSPSPPAAPGVVRAGEAGRAPFIVLVDDTVRALQAFARWVRRESGSAVVAVTGSAGKTTTKDATAAMLATRYTVFRTAGNLNNHIGLPLSLVELRHRPDIAVVELGMNHAGEVRTLVGIAEPDVRVWTNVAEVHTEFFVSLDAVADAKAEILEQSTQGSLLVANADDPLVMARVSAFRGRVLTFGLDSPADVSAVDLEERALDGVVARLRTPAGEVPVHIPLLGRGNVMNTLAATAVAVHFGVPLSDIASVAGRLQSPAHRGEVLRLAGGVTVVDDCYNSNPRALRGVLQVVAREQETARRLAVLGEMLELGPQSRALHEICGRAAAGVNLQYLITVGGDCARALGDSAVAAGMDARRVVHAGTSAEAAELLMRVVRAGDLVLVKGSRGIRTDIVVDRLKAEFA